ncbi:MAG: tripartite tricarboxylate transporter substrate binding protein [Burkholderiales bacterium]|nr:tripartite tricarboxylate transporter substrate binding protein [Burkholderiales bacterium]
MLRTTTAALLAALASGGAHAAAGVAEYPVKPVRIVVPFPPGGSTDIVARLMADQLQQGLRQSFIVDNRGGAGGNLGAELVAKSAPDGYTMLMSSPGPQAINQFLYSKMPYDTEKDFAPVVLVTRQGNVLTVHPSVGVKTVPELIERARAKPGTINYATGGSGTSAHLATVLFTSMTNINLVHIPYKGSGPALLALLSGQVEMMFNTLPAMVPHVRAGKVTALAVSTAQRSATLPDLPTIATYVPGYEASSWLALVAPAGAPAPVIALVNAEVNRMLRKPEVRDRLVALGADPGGGSPRDLAKHLAAETEKWRRIVRLSGAKAD